MGKPPVWLDANIFINLDKWRNKPAFAASKAAYEAELVRLRGDGHELLLVPQPKREVLFGGKQSIQPKDTLRMHQMLTRFGVTIDTMGSKVSRQQINEWFKLANRHGLSREDAMMVAEIKASAQARNIQNPVLLTRDAGGTLDRIRARGVIGVEFRAPLVKPTPPPPPPAPLKLQNPAAPSTPLAPTTPRPGTPKGNGAGGGIVGSGVLLGVLAIGSTIFMPFINKWIINTFLKDKVESDARRLIEETLKGNFYKFNVLTTGMAAQIQAAKASGKSPTLFVELIAEWTETRFGWMQTKAWISNFEVMLNGGRPLQMPLFQPHASWMRGSPSTKLQKHEFSFPL